MANTLHSLPSNTPYPDRVQASTGHPWTAIQAACGSVRVLSFKGGDHPALHGGDHPALNGEWADGILSVGRAIGQSQVPGR